MTAAEARPLLLPDLNVLISAHRADSRLHVGCRDWLLSVYAGDEAFALCAPVVIGLVRILTHPRLRHVAYYLETPGMDAGYDAVNVARARDLAAGRPLAPLPPDALELRAGHVRLFEKLCRSADARGDLVTDAYLAALAIEVGAVLVSADRDFARFAGLRWRRPFD